VGAGAIAAVVACGETLVATSDPADGAASSDGGDGATLDADAGDVADAAIDVGSFDLEVRPACPPPSGGTKPCTGTGGVGMSPCVPEVLYDAPAAEHAFGIVADRRHVFWLSQASGADPGLAYNGGAPAVLRRLDRATHEVEEIAREQLGATTLFAYGPDLFWGADDGSGSMTLRTLRKDVAPCGPDACATPIALATKLPRIYFIGALVPDRVFAVGSDGWMFEITVSLPSQVKRGMSTGYPSFAVGDGYVYLGGAYQAGVERYGASGDQAADLGSIPDASSGAVNLATTCGSVYGRSTDNRLHVIEAAPDGGTFRELTTLTEPFLVYSTASDARFLYFGAANAEGLRRVDTTADGGAVVEIATGSVWGVAVTDDAVIYGEHGALGDFTNPTMGSIYSLAK
jgi:hypothetical protein